MNIQNLIAVELTRLGCSLSSTLGLCEDEDPRLDKAENYAWWTWFANARGH